MLDDKIHIQRETFHTQVEAIALGEERAFFWKNFFRSTAFVTAAVMCGSAFGMRVAFLRESPAGLGYAFHIMGLSAIGLGGAYGWQRYVGEEAKKATKKLTGELKEHKKEGIADQSLKLFKIYPAPILLKYIQEPQENASLIAWAAGRGKGDVLKRHYRQWSWLSLGAVSLGAASLVVSSIVRRGLKTVFPLAMGMISGGLIATMGFREASTREKEEGMRCRELLDRSVKISTKLQEGQVRSLLGQIGGEIGRLQLDIDDKGLWEYISHCRKLKSLFVKGISSLPRMSHLRLRQLHIDQEEVTVVWDQLPKDLRALHVVSLKFEGVPKGFLKLRKLEVDKMDLARWGDLKEFQALNELSIKQFSEDVVPGDFAIPPLVQRLKVPNLPAIDDQHSLCSHERLVEVTLSEPTRGSFEALKQIRMLRKLKLKKSTGLDGTSLDWILKAWMLQEVHLKGPLPQTISSDVLLRLCEKDHYVVLLDGETKKGLTKAEIVNGRPYQAKKVCFKRSGV